MLLRCYRSMFKAKCYKHSLISSIFWLFIKSKLAKYSKNNLFFGMLCFVFFLLGTRICCLSSLSLDRAYLIFTLCKSQSQIMNGSRDKNEIMRIRRSVISSDSLLIFFISNLICKIWHEISNSFLWTRF